MSCRVVPCRVVSQTRGVITTEPVTHTQPRAQALPVDTEHPVLSESETGSDFRVSPLRGLSR